MAGNLAGWQDVVETGIEFGRGVWQSTRQPRLPTYYPPVTTFPSGTYWEPEPEPSLESQLAQNLPWIIGGGLVLYLLARRR